MVDKLSFMEEEGCKLSSKEVQTLCNEVRMNKRCQQEKQFGQSRKKARYRLSLLISGLISLDGYGKELRHGSGEKVVLLEYLAPNDRIPNHIKH